MILCELRIEYQIFSGLKQSIMLKKVILNRQFV